MSIELGVIRVAEGNTKKVTVYKDKEVVGEITISLNCPATEEKIINLLSVLNNSHEIIKYTK